MKPYFRFLLAAGLVAQATQAADITGTIKLTGTPPAETAIPLDPQCGALHPDGMTTRFYVTGADNGLADVVVYLKGITGKSTGASAAPLALDQEGCEYVPYVAAAQTGQTISVKNSDPFVHNVHPTPTTAGNQEQNRIQMPNGPQLTHSYSAPEMFLRFKCDIHPWMFSYISIFDHPYFAVTDKDGKFTISNVPAGTYTLGVWHRKANGNTEMTKEIEVTDAGYTVDMSLGVPAQ